MKIKRVNVTPIAFHDPPLLNSWGVHEPFALRTIVEIILDNGTVGLGEGSGEQHVIELLRSAADHLVGMEVYATTRIESLIRALPVRLEGAAERARKAAVSAYSIIEVACLDAQGQLAGVPVSELLGGRVRNTVGYSGYLFYKWAGHPSGTADEWGEAMDPQGIVNQARVMMARHGFQSLKLKGGVFAPEEEIRAMEALAAEFPGVPLRLDPNGAWTPEVAVAVGDRLDGILEYLEDPVIGTPDMGAVAARTRVPLATNMCVVSFDSIAPAVAHQAVSVILADHHAWGGLRHSRELGAICAAFGIGLSMHSNSHLGISLAAMTHLAAATPNLDYDSDTHYPWNADDDVITTPFTFVDGEIIVPTTPGLGVSLDQDRLAEAHERYLASGQRTRDDTGYMRMVDPTFDPQPPRFALL